LPAAACHEEAKRRSRRNALRHGLTAETVIDGLEDGEDYRAFEAAVVAGYDARTAVERDLVLRLASLLCLFDLFPFLYRGYMYMERRWRRTGVDGRSGCNSAVCPPLSLFAVDPTQNSPKEFSAGG
jgi:hypothetical protein